MAHEREPGPSGIIFTPSTSSAFAPASPDDLKAKTVLPTKKSRSNCSSPGDNPLFEKLARAHPTIARVIAQVKRLTDHVDTMLDSTPDFLLGHTMRPARTPLTVTAERTATQDDVVQDLERHYLLMIDYLRGVPEYTELVQVDQDQLAQRRFFPFYWFKMIAYTSKTRCAGAAFANGSYFPADPEKQPCPDVTRVVSRLCRLLPLFNWLRLDDTEKALLCFIILFHDGVPELTDASREKIRAVQKLFLSVLHYHMSKKEAEYDRIAIRMAKIMLLVSDLTCLAHLTYANLQVHELMHVVSWKKVLNGKLAWIHT